MKLNVTQMLGLIAGLFAATIIPVAAQGDITAVGTELQATATSVATVIGSVITAGLVIFGLIWGVRKAKMGLRAGS